MAGLVLIFFLSFFKDWRLNEYGAADSPQGRLMNKIEAKAIARREFPTYMYDNYFATIIFQMKILQLV
jgi:hypothetical protein